MSVKLPKALRLHQHNTAALEDWFLSKEYQDTEINAIKDPTDSTDKYQITSIPSPFARIDLVKTAFLQLHSMIEGDNTEGSTGDIKLSKLDGNTVYHKLVSDCLDVGELFFNQDKYDKIKIVTWKRDPRNRENTEEDFVKQLIESTEIGHKILGKSLNLYLNQDEESYNFNKLNQISIVLYDHKVIGATSPASVFFSAADANGNIEKIKIGEDILFDDIYNPLYNRNPEYQKYFYYIFEAYPNLQKDMPEFYVYLQDNINKLQEVNHSLYSDIKEYQGKNTEDKLEAYDKEFEKTGYNLLESIHIRKRKIKQDPINDFSDFVISSSKNKQGIRPLVLQNKFKEVGFNYVIGHWQEKYEVPYVDYRSLSTRTLPVQEDKYPYITVSDFLSSTIFRVPYKVNSHDFYFGELQNDNIRESYMLPLKTEFFDYFSIEELRDNKMMKINEVRKGEVEVTLEIPIKRNAKIQFKRTYYFGQKPNIEDNIGEIQDLYFTIASLPFINTNNSNIKPDSRILTVENTTVNKNNDLNLKFYTCNSKQNTLLDFDEQQVKSRSGSQDKEIQHKIYRLQYNYDYIHIDTNQHVPEYSKYKEKTDREKQINLIIIPNFRKYSGGNSEFSFSVDFGTTSTHIEYDVDNSGESKPFDILDDTQIVTFHETNEKITKLKEANTENIIEYLIPEKISKGSEYSFPQRTVISYLKNASSTTIPLVMADVNIPFTYEKKGLARDQKVETNIKWESGNDSGNSEQSVTSFLKNIAYILRNKILLNEGNLSKTKIVWTYPSSMADAKRNDMESKWIDICNEYFSIDPKKNLTKLTESIAPFYYYQKNKQIISAAKPVVSIDIGGGTVDVVVFKDKKPELITSFKYGANYIYGNGTSSENSNNNGFVKHFEKGFRDSFVDKNLKDLITVLDEMKTRPAYDFITFLFSLEDNPMLKKLDVKDISLNTLLKRNEDFKIIFVLYFASIIYHVAKLMRAAGHGDPGAILFSGNGSKTLDILDRSNDHSSLAKLSERIFDKVYDKDRDGSIKIIQSQNPKEITAKGALLSDKDLEVDIEAIRTVLLGTKEDEISPKRSNHKYIITDKTLKELNKMDLDMDLFSYMMEIENQEFNSKEELISKIQTDCPSGHLIMGHEKQVADAAIDSFSKSGFTLNKLSIQELRNTIKFSILKSLLTSEFVKEEITFLSKKEFSDAILNLLQANKEFVKEEHIDLFFNVTKEELIKNGKIKDKKTENVIRYSKIIGYQHKSF